MFSPHPPRPSDLHTYIMPIKHITIYFGFDQESGSVTFELSGFGWLLIRILPILQHYYITKMIIRSLIYAYFRPLVRNIYLLNFQNFFRNMVL
jgi:hypothetical protein